MPGTESPEGRPTTDAESKRLPPRSRWMKWAGLGAFAFFLIKGLLWLAVPAAVFMLAELNP